MKIEKKIENGEHVEVNNWEVFKSYTGTYWIRRELTPKEMNELDFEELGWYSEHFKSLDEALERIGVVTTKQMKFI